MEALDTFKTDCNTCLPVRPQASVLLVLWRHTYDRRVGDSAMSNVLSADLTPQSEDDQPVFVVRRVPVISVHETKVRGSLVVDPLG